MKKELPAKLSSLYSIAQDRRSGWRFIRRSSFNSLGIALARVLGFAFSFILAHAYKPDQYGHVVYSLMLASVISLVIQPFGQHVMAYYIGKYSANLRQLNLVMGNLWVIWMGLLGLTLLVSIPLLIIFGRFSVGTVVVFLGTTLFYTYYGISSGFLSSSRLLVVYVGSNLVQIVLVSIVALVLRVDSVTPAIFIYGLSYLIPLGAVVYFAPLPAGFRFQIHRATIKDILNFSVPIWLSHFLYLGYSVLDVFLLEYFTDEKEVGVYGLTKTISTVFHFFPVGIQLFLMPKVAGSAENEHRLLLMQSLTVVFVVNLIGGILYVLIYPWFIINFIGRDYYKGLWFGLLMALSAMLYAFHTIITSTLVGQRRAPIETISRTIMMLIIIGFGLALIPKHGALGAVVASLLSVVGGLVFYVFVGRFVRGPWKPYEAWRQHVKPEK